jgi:hypothetical protein
MADSTSEKVLKALLSALETAKPAGAKVLRNEVLPERIPAAGLIILRDGNPGEPEPLMSPPHYYYEHRAEVDIIVDRPAKLQTQAQGSVTSARDSTFDALKQAVGAAIAADRTLGGLCDYALGEAPAPLMLPIEGAEGFKAATIPVVLAYGSPDPLL